MTLESKRTLSELFLNRVCTVCYSPIMNGVVNRKFVQIIDCAPVVLSEIIEMGYMVSMTDGKLLIDKII